MKNAILYRTLDDVNAELARTCCERHSLEFRRVDPRDAIFPPEAAGLVFDLDHLALQPSDRADLVQRLHLTLMPYPVAVISYGLEADDIDTLRSCGVLVFRRVGPQLFRALARAGIGAHTGVAA